MCIAFLRQVPSGLGGEMNSVDEYDRIINAIYELLVAPERLPDALAMMTKFLDGDTCHLVGWDRATREPVLSVSSGLAVNIGPDYAAHYAGIDPRLQLAFRMPAGASLACHKRFSPSFVSRSEFYQDYLIPQTGLHYLLGVSDLVPGSRDLLVVGFQRHVGHQHFTDGEIEWFERLMPHFGRVLKVMTAQLTSSQSERVTGVTDRLSHQAVFALDASGRLLEANDRASALLRTNDPLTLWHGKVRATDDRLDSTFRAKLLSAMSGRTSHLTLSSRSRQRSLFVTLLPAPMEPVRSLTNRGLAVVMIASDTAPKRVATAAQLMEFFKLTAAEARLVRALCRGEDVKSYADQEGLKVTTVRSHLKAAMEKTTANTQRELVRIVLTIPAVRN